MKVLIADDRPTTRFALRKNLLEWGHEVVEAADGHQAWEALTARNPPRIAILDWVMPGLDGVEICRRLDKRRDAPLVYTILLTSRTGKEDLVFALESGAHNFQSKPISPEELRSHVTVGERLIESDDTVKKYAVEMERLASLDPLTGVFNRRRFLEGGSEALSRCKRYGSKLSLLILDVDHFKRINDTFGHAAGDEALRALSGKCIAMLRECDLFGRLGGEEFGVLLPETDANGAAEVAGRMRQAAEDMLIRFEDETVHMTISIGAASYRDGDDGFDALLRRADTALYQAKDAGRNRVVVSHAA